MDTSRMTLLAALVAAALVAGCGERSADDAGSTAGTTPSRSTAPGTSPGAAPAPGGGMAGSGTAKSDAGSTAGSTTSGTPTESAAATSADVKLALADKNFITTAAVGGMFAVQASQLAADKATDPAVKAFGNKLVEDHGKANDELKQIAQAKGVTLPTELPAAKKQQLDKLQKASGAQFDRQYVQEVGLKDHQADIRAFEKAAKDAKDPQLKAWAEKTLPVLREHHAKAQTLPGGGSQASTTGRATTTTGAAPASGSDAATAGAAASPGASPSAGATASPGARPSPGADGSPATTATPPPPTR